MLVIYILHFNNLSVSSRTEQHVAYWRQEKHLLGYYNQAVYTQIALFSPLISLNLLFVNMKPHKQQVNALQSSLIHDLWFCEYLLSRG